MTRSTKGNNRRAWLGGSAPPPAPIRRRSGQRDSADCAGPPRADAPASTQSVNPRESSTATANHIRFNEFSLFADGLSGLCFFCDIPASSIRPKAYFREEHFSGGRPDSSKDHLNMRGLLSRSWRSDRSPTSNEPYVLQLDMGPLRTQDVSRHERTCDAEIAAWVRLRTCIF